MNYRRLFRLRAQSSDDVAREIDDELNAHVAMRADDLVRHGEAPERARASAQQRFGDYSHARSDLIEAARGRRSRKQKTEWLSELRQDSAYALRRARQSPGHAAFAVIVMGIAIGLTTATFTLIDGVILRSLPFAQPDRIYALTTLDSIGNEVPVVSMANWVDWKEQSRTLESSALYQSFRTPVLLGAEAMRAEVTRATAQFHDVLGTRMLAGRRLTGADTVSGQGGVVVSEGFWRSALGSRSLPVRITVGSAPVDVVGVVAPGYEFPKGTEIWAGMREARGSGAARNNVNYEAIARVAAGATFEQSDQELDAIAGRIRAADPVGLYSWGVVLRPLKEKIIGYAALYLPILMAAVTFVLLIACANLAGVNLARGVARTREMAVRAALGAGRGRLVRQLLVEHVTLALLAGLLGVVLARWSVRLVVLAAASMLPRVDEIAVRPAVLGFAATLSLAVGVLTGILPALQLSRTRLRDQMGTRGLVGAGRELPGAALVALEVAAALVLLVGSALLVRSYRVLLARDLGFDTRNVVLADVVLSRARYTDPVTSLQYWDRVLPELRAVPGVSAVGVANWVPLAPAGSSFIDVEGRAEANNGAGYRAVSGDYFRAIGIPLVSGRTFDARDDYGTPRVGIMNTTMAEQFFPGESPIGRRIRARGMESAPDGKLPDWITIVGVAGDVRHWGLQIDPRPELYVLYRQVPGTALSLSAVVRVQGDVAPVISTLRAKLRALDPTTPADLYPLQQRLDQQLLERQLIMGIMTGLGGLALFLSCVGLYSLLAFAVSQRTREIAVRVALGARRASVLRMVLSNALKIVAAGAAVGVLAGAGLTRFLSEFLVQVEPFDPVSFSAVTVLLLLTGALAALVPAWRAARLDPLTALNAE
jgi:predicted permease